MWVNSSLSLCIPRADLSFRVRYPGVTLQGLRNRCHFGRAGLGATWLGILGNWGDCEVAVEIDWEGFPFCSLIMEGEEAERIGFAGNAASSDPLPQLSLALGSRHIPCRPLLRVRRAVFAAVVDSDERDGEEGKEDEGGLLDGVVLWREDTSSPSVHFLI